MQFKSNVVTSIFETGNTSEIVVYPNPFGSEGLHVSTEQEASYVLYNLIGAVVEQGNLSTEQLIGKNLAQGSYLLSVQKTNGEIQQTFVVKQ